jgi:hypothetical protein
MPPIVRASWLRGVSALPNTFAHESWIDEVAAEAGVDPIEYRLRYLKDSRAIDLVNAVAERAGWKPRPVRQEPEAEGDIVRGRGFAYALYVHSKFPGYGAAWSAWIADVAVNKATGDVSVTRVVAGQDSGLMINPDGVRHQIHGNVIQSTSRALMEEVSFDRTSVTAREWGAYPIIKFPEVPEIDRDDSGPIPRVNVSVKLSALFSQFDPIDPEGTSRRVKERLRPILSLAKRNDAFVNFDMEQYAFKGTTIRIFREVLEESEYRDWPHVGIAVQAYLKDTEQDLRDLLEWRIGAPIGPRPVDEQVAVVLVGARLRHRADRGAADLVELGLVIRRQHLVFADGGLRKRVAAGRIKPRYAAAKDVVLLPHAVDEHVGVIAILCTTAQRHLAGERIDLGVGEQQLARQRVMRAIVEHEAHLGCPGRDALEIAGLE